MVKKAQVRFITITMSIILLVFAVIYGLTCFLFDNTSKTVILDRIDRIYYDFTENQVFLENNALILQYTENQRDPQNSNFTVIHIGNNFSEDNKDKIVNEIISSPFPNGNVDNVFYSLKGEGRTKTVVAFDTLNTAIEYQSNNAKILLYLSLIYIVLFLLVFALSFEVLRPIKATLTKQKTFISDASHELKTPIAIISANADVIKAGNDSVYLESIKTQTERLNFLVKDLLTLSKIDEGETQIKKQTFSLSKEIETNVFPFEALAFETGKTLDFDIQENITYNGDLESVKKVLSILVDNAIKYSIKGGTIKITLKKEGNRPLLEVYNSGSLIKNEDSNRIFERFYRGDDSRSRDSGGSGLGLAIAKSICDLNKWRISAKSEYKKSMTIKVYM